MELKEYRKWQSSGGKMSTQPLPRRGSEINRCFLISAPPPAEEDAFGWRPNPFLISKYPPSSVRTFCP